jgi:myosin heavy subunit
MELQERLTNIQLSIELALYRRTTAAVLQKKYKEVKEDIEAENGQYEIILKEMEKKIEELYSEQESMDNILCIAVQFQKQKLKDLRDFEKAYNTNYKIRRAQIKRKRKQTEDKLEQEERNAIIESQRIQAEQQKVNDLIDPKKAQLAAERMSKLREKLEAYRIKLTRLQDVMRVEDINKVVTRMRHVVWLAYHLENETALKSQLNVALEKQRNNLLLLKCHMKYSGYVESREYSEKKAALEADREAIDAEVQKIHEKMHKFAMASHEGTLGILTLLRKLGDRYTGARTYKQRIKTMYSLMEKLKDELITAREEVSDPTAERKPFLKSLKPHRPEKRLVRVGTPPPSDDDEIDEATHDALADRMVPGREQIKERSVRFMKRIQMKKVDDIVK